MALEHHPRFQNYIKAVDRLKGALDSLTSALARGEPEAVLVAARADVTLAQSGLEDVQEEIGYA